MCISVLFSLFIYFKSTEEIDRILRLQRFRIEHPAMTIQVSPNGGQSVLISPNKLPELIDPELLEDAKRRILIVLVDVNLIILAIAGTLGYYLAGRTLRPIQEMVDEQNRFVTDASHELRTPLTAAKTTIEVGLRDKDLSLNQAKDLLESTLEEVDTMQVLSNNLLRLAQIQNKQKQEVRTAVPLGDVIQKVVQKVSLLAKQKTISIKAGETDAIVEGNFETLKELFIIFLDNAIKYSPEGSAIMIDISRKDHVVAVEIRDKGIGIAKKDIPHIFNRFYRADESRSKSNASGYGLGLSIAKKIIDEYRGSISVKSKIDEGTTFTIKLPTK
jgi:signal transduction histidine kinase